MMDPTVLVALCSLAGTLGGSLIGAITSTQLIKYRIDQLEQKVDKHNKVIERVTVLEVKQHETENDMDAVFNRVRDLEMRRATS